MSVRAKLTMKYQATVPAEIRRFLKLEKGDSIGFEIENGVVILRKLMPLDVTYAAALSEILAQEWGSDNDEEAYGHL